MSQFLCRCRVSIYTGNSVRLIFILKCFHIFKAFGFKPNTLNGSEIRRSPVEVGSSSPIHCSFFTFHQQDLRGWMPQSAEVVRVPKVILEKTWTPWMRLWCAVGLHGSLENFWQMELWEDWLPIPFGTFFCPLRISSCGVLVDGFGQLQSRKKIVWFFARAKKTFTRNTPLVQRITTSNDDFTCVELNKQSTWYAVRSTCCLHEMPMEKFTSPLCLLNTYGRNPALSEVEQNMKNHGYNEFSISSSISSIISNCSGVGRFVFGPAADAFEFSRCCLHVSPST